MVQCVGQSVHPVSFLQVRFQGKSDFRRNRPKPGGRPMVENRMADRVWTFLLKNESGCMQHELLNSLYYWYVQTSTLAFVLN